MKRKTGTRILTVLIFACICFIWGNSLLSADESSALSGGLLAWLIQTFPFLNWLPEFLLRKLMHFTEFAGTAFLMAWLFLLKRQRGYHRFTMPLLCGILIAMIDESIQMFTPGRACAVTDVWIDTAGVCLGISVLLIGNALYRWIFRRT